jgi:hypothetical protein
MSRQTKEAHTQSKRPYERPRLESSEIFGAEAAWGSCCRTTNQTCSTAMRTAAYTIDMNKVRRRRTS